jgi:hypothetical protein
VQGAGVGVAYVYVRCVVRGFEIGSGHEASGFASASEQGQIAAGGVARMQGGTRK